MRRTRKASSENRESTPKQEQQGITKAYSNSSLSSGQGEETQNTTSGKLIIRSNERDNTPKIKTIKLFLQTLAEASVLAAPFHSGVEMKEKLPAHETKIKSKPRKPGISYPFPSSLDCR